MRLSRPERVDFRLVRGPVPAVTESFTLTARGAGTRLVYEEELATDLCRAEQWWGSLVAPRWEAPSPRPWQQSDRRPSGALPCRKAQHASVRSMGSLVLAGPRRIVCKERVKRCGVCREVWSASKGPVDPHVDAPEVPDACCPP